MKLLIIIIIFLKSTLTFSQNLVNNPSFEQYWFCEQSTSPDTFPCKFWFTPNFGSPDYFNVCMKDSDLGVPKNANGTYYPYSGNAYIGIGAAFENDDIDMEHITGRLKETLKPNTKYEVSFRVKFAYMVSDYSTYNLGAFLSQKKPFSKLTDGPSYMEEMEASYAPQVSNPKGNFLSDTAWVEITGDFVAKGGEKFITIGSFWLDLPALSDAFYSVKKDDAPRAKKKFQKIYTNNILRKNGLKSINHKNDTKKVAYYLIDNVSVTKE